MFHYLSAPHDFRFDTSGFGIRATDACDIGMKKFRHFIAILRRQPTAIMSIFRAVADTLNRV